MTGTNWEISNQPSPLYNILIGLHQNLKISFTSQMSDLSDPVVHEISYCKETQAYQGLPVRSSIKQFTRLVFHTVQ